MHPIVQALTHYADESGAAQILVHHGRKSDGKYRDSSAIGAAVDVIIEMGASENAADSPFASCAPADACPRPTSSSGTNTASSSS